MTYLDCEAEWDEELDIVIFSIETPLKSGDWYGKKS